MKSWRMSSLVGILLGGLMVCSAEAAIRPHAFFLHPHAGFYDFHHDQVQKDAPLYAFGLGYRFGRDWSSEIIATFIDSAAKGTDKEQIDSYLLRWEAQYLFRPEDRLVPYLAAGIGGILHDRQGGDSDLDGVIGYGLGLQAFLTENLSFRIDGRHFLTIENRKLDGREFNNLVASAGIVVDVGGEEEKPELIDTDGDGIIDAFDRCPDTPLGVPVDGFGCPADADHDGVPDPLDKCPSTPAGTPPGREGCPREGERDSDGDGVVDAQDQCPGTTSGVAVEGDGCPRDTDRDGVPDHRDRCSDTPAGTMVDGQGCPVPVVLDTDGDGVEDVRDKCPDTPSGTAVDAEGCPPPVAADSDADGVPDVEDRCPNTRPNIPVDRQGCPADEDQDGVPDVADKCPGTPAGTPVDGAGCPPKPLVGETLILHLEFALRESALQAKEQGRLREAIDFIRANPGRRLVVEGHTDSIGAAEANLRLSRQRAENVRRFLIEKAPIAPERIAAEGYGETHPIADNATPEGRLKNRRIVIRVLSDQ